MYQINKPVIVVNFKTYEEASNDNALKLAKECENVSTEIVACVNSLDFKEVAKNVSIPVFTQHIDLAKYGSCTGKIVPEIAKSAGAVGTLLNHSEDRYDKETLRQVIAKCKKQGIYTIVCSQDCEESVEIAKMSPDAIAVEPPELIGGDISVTTANPAIVSDTVKAVKEVADIPVLCGAGVKTKEDVRKSIELGAMGVLLASGVTKATDPESVLKDLNEGLN